MGGALQATSRCCECDDKGPEVVDAPATSAIIEQVIDAEAAGASPVISRWENPDVPNAAEPAPGPAIKPPPAVEDAMQIELASQFEHVRVRVERFGNDSLGLVLDSKTFAPNHIVKRIAESGAVQRQNNTGGPTLEPGDLIRAVECNGESAGAQHEEFRSLLGRGGPVTFTISRCRWIVELVPSKGEDLGLYLKQMGYFAVVAAVSGGTAGEFNRVSAAKAIKVNDILFSVNGKEKYEDILPLTEPASAKLRLDVIRLPVASDSDVAESGGDTGRVYFGPGDEGSSNQYTSKKW